MIELKMNLNVIGVAVYVAFFSVLEQQILPINNHILPFLLSQYSSVCILFKSVNFQQF